MYADQFKLSKLEEKKHDFLQQSRVVKGFDVADFKLFELNEDFSYYMYVSRIRDLTQINCMVNYYLVTPHD